MRTNCGLSPSALVIATLCTVRFAGVAVIVANIWILKSFLERLVIMLVVDLYRKNGSVVVKNASQWQINITLIFLVSTKMRMLYF